LKVMAYIGHAAKLSFHIVLDDHTAQQVTRGLLSIWPIFTIAQAKTLKSGSVQIQPCRLNLRRKPRWQDTIRSSPSLRELLPPHPIAHDIHTSMPGPLKDRLASARLFLSGFRVSCPHCLQSRHAPNIVPRFNYKWATLTCPNTTCRKLTKANLWLCPCNSPWRTCTVHSTWDAHAKLQRANAPTCAPVHQPAGTAPPLLPAKRRAGDIDRNAANGPPPLVGFVPPKVPHPPTFLSIIWVSGSLKSLGLLQNSRILY